MIVRVRSNVGVWRVTVPDDATVATLKEEIKKTRPAIVFEIDFCFDPACRELIAPELDLSDQGVEHGSMVHCRVDPKTAASTEIAPAETSATAALPAPRATGNFRRVIDKDGNVHLVPSSEVRDPSQDKGFRKGQLKLRDMKMHWTCKYTQIDALSNTQRCYRK
jgi:Nuclear pore localisation protein NPL4